MKVRPDGPATHIVAIHPGSRAKLSQSARANDAGACRHRPSLSRSSDGLARFDHGRSAACATARAVVFACRFECRRNSKGRTLSAGGPATHDSAPVPRQSADADLYPSESDRTVHGALLAARHGCRRSHACSAMLFLASLGHMPVIPVDLFVVVERSEEDIGFCVRPRRR